MTQYRILVDHEEYGPYSEFQLQSMCTSGSITLDAYYWTEGMKEWRPVSELPLIAAPPKVNTNKSLSSKWLLAFIAICTFFVVFLANQVSTPTGAETSTALDKARAIAAGNTPAMASANKGFLTIDKVLSHKYSAREAADSPGELLVAATVVNKLLSVMGKQELIDTYEAWCSEEHKTSFAKFPEFVALCQKEDTRKMTDAITKELTK